MNNIKMIRDIKKHTDDINEVNSQLDTKANKTETQNIQAQINNLVLGAVGDGNNAEVVQARGEFNVLNERLNVFTETTKEFNEQLMWSKHTVLPLSGTVGALVNSSIIPAGDNSYLIEYEYSDSGSTCIRFETPYKLSDVDYVIINATFSEPTNASGYVGIGHSFFWNSMKVESCPTYGLEYEYKLHPKDILTYAEGTNSSKPLQISAGAKSGTNVKCTIKFQYKLKSDTVLSYAKSSEYSMKSDYAKNSDNSKYANSAGCRKIDISKISTATNGNIITEHTDGTYNLMKPALSYSNNYWYGFYLKVDYEKLQDLNCVMKLGIKEDLTNNRVPIDTIRIVATANTDWGVNSRNVVVTTDAKNDNLNIYNKIMNSGNQEIIDYYSSADRNSLYIAFYYSRGTTENAIKGESLLNINPVIEIPESNVLATNISNTLKENILNDAFYNVQDKIHEIPIGIKYSPFKDYQVRENINNLVTITQKTLSTVNVSKTSTDTGGKYCGVYIKMSYESLDELDGDLLIRYTKNGGTLSPGEIKILNGVSDWGSASYYPISISLNTEFNLKDKLVSSGFDYASRTELYFTVLAYSATGVTGTIDFDVSVEFTPKNQNTVQANAITRELREDLLKGIETTTNYITCWGDSLTAGGGWTSTLQSLTGLTVHNGGTGGENSQCIMARQGGDVMQINNITIPADTTTPVIIASRGVEGGITTQLGKKVTPLLQGGSHVNPCYIGDVEGTLRWTGSSYADMTGTWTFTRTKAGSAVTINRPTAIRTDFDINKNKPKVMIIFIGQNGGYTDTNDLIRQHKLMISHSKCVNYIVLGLSSGTASVRAEYENSMKLEFGRKFVSLREYLSTYGLADANITATQQDLDMMAQGQTPQSLLTDSVHYTTECKTVIGNMLYKKMKDLNYI